MSEFSDSLTRRAEGSGLTKYDLAVPVMRCRGALGEYPTLESRVAMLVRELGEEGASEVVDRVASGTYAFEAEPGPARGVWPPLPWRSAVLFLAVLAAVAFASGVILSSAAEFWRVNAVQSGRPRVQAVRGDDGVPLGRQPVLRAPRRGDPPF